MASRKLVLKLDLDLHNNKNRKKVLEALYTLDGIDSIAVDMDDSKLTVVGLADPVHVAAKLRKLGAATIVSVGPAKEEKKDDQKERDKKLPLHVQAQQQEPIPAITGMSPPDSEASAAAAGGGGARLRLMCSFGGRIVPRPTDRSLCYLGGETRLVAVDRHASLADVHASLSGSLLGGRPFTLKYQLPKEDLDSLISVSTDKDLDNLVDEYDRLAATSRIRLFLFPAEPDSSSSLGSLDGRISTDSASGNRLLGLEDDPSVHSRSGLTKSAPTEDQRASQLKLPVDVAAAAAATQAPPGYVVAQMHAPPPLQQPPPPQQLQQRAPQQIVAAGNQHFIHNPATGTFIPIQSYYHHPLPQHAPQTIQRKQQAPTFDPNTGMYYVPMQQNAHQPYSMPPGAKATLPPPTLVDTTPKKPTVPIPQMAVRPELQQPRVYRTTTAATPAPAPNAAPGNAGMAYHHHHVIQSHHHPAPQPIANMAGNYGYEFADPTRPQVYYSQAAAPPTLPPQYPPIVSPDDVQSVPDSPMLDNNSSFGSASSASSLSNLPPIRVRPDDRPSDARIMKPTADHFAQMGISEQQLPAYIQAQQQVPISTKTGMSRSEASSRVFSDGNRSDHGGVGRKLQPPEPVSSSLGAMGPLFRKLDLLLAPEYPLRRSIKHAIKLLKEDLEDIFDALVEQSMMDSPNHMARYWMHEARELSYHIEDVIDAMTTMLPRTAADGKRKAKSSAHGHSHKVARLKTRRLLPNILIKPSARIARIAELRALLWEASERYERYQLDDGCVSSSRPVFFGRSLSRIPVDCHVAGDLVGVDGPRNELTRWLTDQAEQELKIVCVVGPAGVGKTALAKQVYRELCCQFECRAFIRVPRKPHMCRLLWGMLSQIQRPNNKQDPDDFSVQTMIHNIRKHLQNKRYFIVIDGLWETQVWDIMNSAFPKGHNCSRIMITCEVNSVAVELCSYQSVNVLELKPLGSQDSEKLFFDRISVSGMQCPDQLKEVSCRILRESGGLPLATITFAGLLASQPDNSDRWYDLQQYLVSNLANISSDDMLKEIVNFCYNSLPQCLKTCLLYISMYPEGCTIRKVDLVNQWIAEGFISAPTEETERVAESYFDELVNRGMFQPEKIIHGDEVLSCTVHHIVFDLLMHKSREENFSTAVDYSQTTTEFCVKAHRLSLHFSRAQYAEKPKVLRMSQVRSLAFFGLIRCMPSAMEFKVLRVLILELWADCIGCMSLNLSRISKLFHLRYLKISSHIFVKLQPPIQGLKLLETLEIDATVSEIDISCLPGLLHLSLQDGTKLPDGIDRIISLQTLQYFDLGKNSEDNIRSLGELINLRDLHITCSTALSDENLKRKLVILASSLGRLANLRSVTLDTGAIGNKTMFVDHPVRMFSTPSIFLQRLELLPPICIFSRLPDWIGELKALRVLKIVVGIVLTHDIDVLTGLPDLTVLSLCIRQPNSESVVFSSGALPVLKYFKYTCGTLRLAFEEEALPNVQRLKLCFNVCIAENSSRMISGIEHLSNLKEIAVNIGAAAGAKEYILRAAESWFKDAIHKHPKLHMCLNVKNDGRIEEKSRPLGFLDGIIFCLGFVLLVVVVYMLFWY